MESSAKKIFPHQRWFAQVSIATGFATWLSESAARIGCLVLSSILVLSCQHQPTTVSESYANIDQTYAGDSLKGDLPDGRFLVVPPPLLINEKTVFVDTRSQFEFSTSHISRSVSLQWDEFSQNNSELRGLLQKDYFAISRRLARLGIDQDSQIIVLGHGKDGRGEEGRMAWMLQLLGVKQVQIADYDSVRAKRMADVVQATPKLGDAPSVASGPTQPLPRQVLNAKPMWKPEVDESLICEAKELEAVLKNGGLLQAYSYQGAPPVLYRILDVRTPAEYLGKVGIGVSQRQPDLGSLNIPWTEFLDPKGRPQLAIAKELLRLRVSPRFRILVLSEQGVRSALVTKVLRDLGFKNAANCSGGLRELMASKSSLQ